MEKLQAAGIGLVLRGFAVFFFQAEDGIRDATVTGVQTCALPICVCRRFGRSGLSMVLVQMRPASPAIRACGAPSRTIRPPAMIAIFGQRSATSEIGRASCRERV